MPSRRGPSPGPKKTRAPLHLALTKAEFRARESWAESELRSVSNLVSYMLAEHLRTERRLAPVEAPKGSRHPHNVQVWLTAKQRKELRRRAEDQMRTVANYATAVVVRALRGRR